MKRILVITIGKTHSGKTSFAKVLEQQLPNSLVIDQDNHALFLHEYYRKLVPVDRSNDLKIGLSQYILQYAIEHTDLNIIISSANLSKEGRLSLLEKFFPQDKWKRVYVYFDYSNENLQKRIAHSIRTKNIFREQSMTFEQLLVDHTRQLVAPTLEEVSSILYIDESHPSEEAIQEILTLWQ